MYRRALTSILSELVRQERLVVVEELTIKEPKTRELLATLEKLKLEKAFIVIDGDDRNLGLSARNLPKVDVCDVARVNPLNLVSAEKILITVAAIKKLEERLS